MKTTRNVRLGRVCKKHPELNGLRYVGNSCCTECCIEASRRHYANLELTPAQKITTLLGEVARLKKALVDVRDAVQREYWDEYAGMDETRNILDAAIGDQP